MGNNLARCFAERLSARLLASLLAGSILLFLSACSDDDGQTPTPTPKKIVTSQFDPVTTLNDSSIEFGLSNSFLESIQTNKLTAQKTIHQAIKNWAKKPGSYMSLGESHLESETAQPINHSLAVQFMSNTSKKATFCSETILDFLDSKYGQDIQSRAATTKLFLSNSYTETDFKNCKWKSKENAITYSGFIHQYRFAYSWPSDFPMTPVITEPGNNILDQLLPRQGLFISQIELLFLQALASRNIILSGETNTTRFRARANALTGSIVNLKNSMELIYGPQNNPYKNKYGTYVGRSAITEEVIMNNSSWFLLTSRGIHRQELQTSFLRKLLALNDQTLTAFLKKLKGKKIHLSVGFNGPDSMGTRFNLSYSGLNVDGEAEILSLEDRVMVSNYNTAGFQCYTVGVDSPKEPAALDCAKFF